MITYYILRDPGYNRVYYDQAESLAVAEMNLALGRLQQPVKAVQLEQLAGVTYMSFAVPGELSQQELRLLANLSFLFALFRNEGSRDKPLLAPIQVPVLQFVDPKISNLLKYAGKTNERFTRTMINVALLSSPFESDRGIHLLDPVAGKGTTLFEGLIYGYRCTGVEIDRKATHEMRIFFKKFLEREKFKHETRQAKLYSANAAQESLIHEFEFAAEKVQFKDPGQRGYLGIVSGNTLHARRYFKTEKFHLLVGDLPYGVAHGNVAKGKHKSPTRNPSELVSSAAPQWLKILKPGGVLVLAWNQFVLKRPDLIQVLDAAGFSVFDDGPYRNFVHRVDQSILRDMVVAQRPLD